MVPDLLNVQNTVQEAVNILSSSRDGSEISKTLSTIKGYLDGTNISSKEKDEFIRNHFTPFLQCLICNLSPDWAELFQADKEKELWNSFFLEGPAEQSFMVLLDSIVSTEPSFRLNKVVDVLELFLQRAGVSTLMWEVCKQQTQVGVSPLQETILNKVVCLPDHLGNKLQERNRLIFSPQNYFPFLGMEIIKVLERIFASLRGGLDCSISFVSQVLGKTCVHGRQKEILTVLVPHLAERTQSDCIWQRMCWRLVESVPDRWMEAVICGFIQVSGRSDVLSRLLGNLIVKNKKAQFVMTQKLLLLHYNYPTAMLQTIFGYLAMDSMRHPLLHKILKGLLETWGSSSAVKHTPVEQQLYISKAILICLSHLKEAELMSSKQELLTSLMEGMKCHLDSNLPRIRHMGMVVAESVSGKIMPEGPALKFTYVEDDEIRELKTLLNQSPEETSVIDLPSTESSSPPSVDLQHSVKPDSGVSELVNPGADSDLDSDDDLVPYDMSQDQELKKIKAPTYIRDCIEILTGPEDADRNEATMSVIETLIRRDATAAREVSVELAKVLLHLEEKTYIEGFAGLRESALVAVITTDPVMVTQYLASEFYSLNYSLRQRIDILEFSLDETFCFSLPIGTAIINGLLVRLDALAMAAQELSQPLSLKPQQLLSPKHPSIEVLSSDSSPPAWQKVVDERINRKTRRFAKGPSRAEPSSAPNRFAPVAGHFFFPLLQNFDRPLTTFDLLGDDHLVLGQLAHTLAFLMYHAINSGAATAMGKALLEFVWALRFHTDTYVRQGLLSSVTSILHSVPAEHLLDDMAEDLMETRFWLADVAEKDPDDACRSAALQSLRLMGNLKKKLERAPFQ